MHSGRAVALLERSVVWENHACLSFIDLERCTPQLVRYRRAGFNLVHVNVGDSDIPLEKTIQLLAFFRAWVRARPTDYALVRSVEDITSAKRDGKLGVCFDLEGTHAIGTDLELVPLLYELGVRWMLLVYNRANLVGGGCHDEIDAGLTPFGRRLLAEMDRVGMIKDVAHTGYRTAMEVCEASTTPVNISHSNPRSLRDHPRCVPPELMQACARTGGVLGISGVGIFLGDNDIDTATMVQSIERAVDVMGVDHVGLGLDYVFDTPEMDNMLARSPDIWPAGFGYGPGVKFVEPERIPELTEALLARGYPDADVAKILGENFMRVASAVWK